MKKRISIILAAVMMSAMVPSVNAAETWREAFVTRLMRAMSQNPSYQDIVLTDLDFNGIPEAFIVKDGTNGGIGAGITMQGNVVTNIEVQGNVIGKCLEDLTIYEENGEYRVVGKEIGRYSSNVEYYYITFDGTTLKCEPTKKSVFQALPAIPYMDVYASDFMINGYPNRAKISDFIEAYVVPNKVKATISSDKIVIDGEEVEIVGYNINYSNYYKVRDIAMLLRTTGSRFNVGWDDSLGGINIQTGVRYSIAGGELDLSKNAAGSIEENNAPVYVDGIVSSMQAYNIDGNNYFKIRDLGDAAGFNVDWDADRNCVVINTK